MRERNRGGIGGSERGKEGEIDRGESTGEIGDRVVSVWEREKGERKR